MILALLACSTPAPPPPEPVVVPKPPPVVVHRYVTASTLNFRAAPAADADVLRRLPINTPVVVGRVQGDFAEVTLSSGQTGWVGAAYLGSEQLTKKAALTQFHQTDDAAEKLSWIQRAAALAPVDAEVLEHLRDTYESAGQPALAEQVRVRMKDLSGTDYERCFPAAQRTKIEALGARLRDVSDLDAFIAARSDALALSRELAETLDGLWDWETEKVCGKDGIDWMSPLLPGIQVDYGPEGLGVVSYVDLDPFEAAAKRTPSPDDDAFVALARSIYTNFELVGWASFEHREWDYGGCSSLGSGQHLAILKAADAVAGTPFADPALEVRRRVIDDIVTDDEEFFPFCQSTGVPTEGAVLLAEVEKILAEVKLTDEERGQLEARKSKGFPKNP